MDSPPAGTPLFPDFDPLLIERDFDMIDLESEIQQHWPLLRDSLDFCKHQILKPYFKADKDAMRWQAHHKWITFIAAVCGSVAVLLAISQLALQRTFERANHMAAETELFSALLAVVAVVFGLRAARHRQWLLERHRAERLRLLKFEFMIDSATYPTHSPEMEERRKEILTKVHHIQHLTETQMEHWLEHQVLPDEDGAEDIAGSLSEAHEQLRHYIRQKHVLVQMRYFRDRGQAAGRTDRFLNQLPPGMFFASVLCVFIHAGWDQIASHTASLEAYKEAVATFLTFCAATLPVLGAGVRTMRSAMEYGRNTLRFLAASNSLKDIDQEISAATSVAVLQDRCFRVHQVLEVEHREWLRLMIDAEWFG